MSAICCPRSGTASSYSTSNRGGGSGPLKYETWARTWTFDSPVRCTRTLWDSVRVRGAGAADRLGTGLSSFIGLCRTPLARLQSAGRRQRPARRSRSPRRRDSGRPTCPCVPPALAECRTRWPCLSGTDARGVVVPAPHLAARLGRSGFDPPSPNSACRSPPQEPKRTGLGPISLSVPRSARRASSCAARRHVPLPSRPWSRSRPGTAPPRL